MCNLKIFQEPGFGGSGTAFSACADLPSLSDAPVMGSVKSAPKSTAVMGAFCSTQYRQPASTSRSFDIASQIHQYLSCAHFGTFPFGCEGSTGTSTSMSSDYRQSVACWRSRDRCSASDVFTWKGIYVRSLRRAPTLHACSDAIELSQFFRFLLQEIGFGQDKPTLLPFSWITAQLCSLVPKALFASVVRSTSYGSRISSLRLCSSKKLL